jgi:crossover junction endodeoxyribonuclease RuvC
MAITGNGNASKTGCRNASESFEIKRIPTKYLDASDGLAVAVCHHFNSGTLTDTNPIQAGKVFKAKSGSVKINILFYTQQE